MDDPLDNVNNAFTSYVLIHCAGCFVRFFYKPQNNAHGRPRHANLLMIFNVKKQTISQELLFMFTQDRDLAEIAIKT